MIQFFLCGTYDVVSGGVDDHSWRVKKETHEAFVTGLCGEMKRSEATLHKNNKQTLNVRGGDDGELRRNI